MEHAVDLNRRTERAVPQAEDLVEGDRHRRSVVCAEVESELDCAAVGQVATRRPTGKPRRDRSERWSRPAGLVAEVAVEARDAVYVGARQVEFVGDQRDDLWGDAAEFVLDGVQDREQRAPIVSVVGHDLAYALIQLLARRRGRDRHLRRLPHPRAEALWHHGLTTVPRRG